MASSSLHFLHLVFDEAMLAQGGKSDCLAKQCGKGLYRIDW